MTTFVFNNYIGYIGGLYYYIFNSNHVVKDYTKFFNSSGKQQIVFEYLELIIKDLKEFIAIILPENHSNIEYNNSDMIGVIKFMYSIKNELSNGKAMTLTEGYGYKESWISVGRYHFIEYYRSTFVKKCKFIIKLLNKIQSKMNYIVKLNVKKEKEKENERIRRQIEYEPVIRSEEGPVLTEEEEEEDEDEPVERIFKDSPVKRVYGESDSFIKSTTSPRPSSPSSFRSSPRPSSPSSSPPPPSPTTGGKRTRRKKRNTKKYKKINKRKTRKYRK